jgi:hypothetical protein
MEVELGHVEIRSMPLFGVELGNQRSHLMKCGVPASTGGLGFFEKRFGSGAGPR